MRINRLSKILTAPFFMLFAKLYPVKYAKYIGVKIDGNVTIYGSSYNMFSSEPFLVSLGDNVHISVNARFVCHDGAVLPFRRETPDLDVAKKINVGNNVFIGMEALILPGVKIGDNSIIAARAVVSKDVPNGTVVAGNPARKIKTTLEYLEKAKRDSTHLGELIGEKKLKAYKTFFEVE